MKSYCLAAAFLLTIAGAAAQPARPLVGAIRWDAWSGGEITREVEKTLGPQKYHHRLPWFARVATNGSVKIDGGVQSVMDKEIGFASQAGLDYWAFLLYPENNSMSQALKSYLASVRRQQIGFCVILHNSFGVSEQEWPRERERALALLKEAGYQTVLGGRPLVYALQVDLSRFREFHRAARGAGLDPYCVYMGWNAEADFRQASTNGFHAVSNYAYGSEAPGFADLCEAVEKHYWQNARAARVPYVPLVTTGWDKRPRKDHPVSWEHGHAYHQQKVFPGLGTPDEIAAHLKRALEFVRGNPAICAANALIVYAWNEHDEGGWLSPTWTKSGVPDTSRLEAVARVLRPK